MIPAAARRRYLPTVTVLSLLAGCAPAAQPVGNHPLYPLRAGAKWVYRAEGVAAAEARRVDRTAAVDDWIAGRIVVDAAYQVRPLWVVTGADGVRLLPGEAETPPAAEAIAAAPLFLPSEAAVRAGASWHYQGLVPFALTTDGDDPLTEGPPPQMTAELKAVGEERLQVAGQTYDALKIELRGQHDVGREMRTEEELWFAPGVGLVQHRARVGEQSPVTWQLVEVEGLAP